MGVYVYLSQFVSSVFLVKHLPCCRISVMCLFFFFFKGRKSEAEKHFLKAIQLDPTKGNCYMHYGKSPVDSYSLHIPSYCHFLQQSKDFKTAMSRITF